MIVQKIQLENGTYGPNIPKGLEYQLARINEDGQTYTIIFSEEQKEANRISPAQGKTQLHRENKLSQIAQHIEQGSNEELKIFWEYATFWDRHTASVKALAQHFEIDLDEFWSKAKMIEV